MPSRLVRCPTLAPTPYAGASVADPGARLVHLAGACPLDAEGATVPAVDVVAFVRVLVAPSERGDLVDAWQTYKDDFGDHDPPATLQGVTVLGYPDQLVEVEAVASTGV